MNICQPATNSTTSGDTNTKPIALCASCDRCRARKTKCDGQRPCGNCAAKYMKKHKLTSIEGIPLEEFECVYSPAKRRGPVPGKAGARKVEEMDDRSKGSMGNVSAGGGGMAGMMGNGAVGGMNGLKNSNLMRMDMSMTGMMGNNNMLQQNQQLAAMGMSNNNLLNGMNNMNGGMNMNNMNGNNKQGNGGMDMNDSLSMQQKLLNMQQQQLLMQQQGMGMDQSGGMYNANQNGMANPMAYDMLQQQLQLQQQQQEVINKMMEQMKNNNNNNSNGQVSGQEMGLNGNQTNDATSIDNQNLSKIASKHLLLLEKSSMVGNRLRAHYSLSIDSLLMFPPIPSDEEYCAKLNIVMNPIVLPQFDLSALRAARFAEIALGALISNEIPLSLELSNSVIGCLKQCADQPVHPSVLYEVARAFFLHGLFRSYRGDMQRYFTYRRICLSKLAQLAPDTKGIEALLAAISFHDSFVYMVYNANEHNLPKIDEVIPPVSNSTAAMEFATAAEKKYKVSTDPTRIASNPTNQMWIQGPPPVFINKEAPPLSRALDALACAVRTCCDEANSQLDEIIREAASEQMQVIQESNADSSLTAKAINANKDELCARNMILCAFVLLQQSEESGMERNHGQHLLVSAMDAFLEDGDEDDAGGFSDSQIQSLLSVSNTVIDKPALLYQPGPTYFMVTNTAVLLCHLLNALHASRSKQGSSGQSLSEMESALYDEVLDTYIALRKLLNCHRRKLPMLLRCHGLPRPKLLNTNDPTTPLIDLGETLMCACRASQGFVLMGSSPIVAAERAAAAELRNKEEASMVETDNGKDVEMDGSDNLDRELTVEDDALIGILGKVVSN